MPKGHVQSHIQKKHKNSRRLVAHGQDHSMANNSLISTRLPKVKPFQAIMTQRLFSPKLTSSRGLSPLTRARNEQASEAVEALRKNNDQVLEDTVGNELLGEQLKQSHLKIRFIKNDLKVLVETEANKYISLIQQPHYQDIVLQSDEIPTYCRIEASAQRSPMTLIILKKSQDVKVLISTKHKYPGIGCEHSYDDDDPVYYAKNRLNY